MKTASLTLNALQLYWMAKETQLERTKTKLTKSVHSGPVSVIQKRHTNGGVESDATEGLKSNNHIQRQHFLRPAMVWPLSAWDPTLVCLPAPRIKSRTHLSLQPSLCC